MADARQDRITVEVVCALPERQQLVKLQLPPRLTAREAVAQAKLQPSFPELDLATAPLAVFGVVVDDSHELVDGDRVEVLRPLQRDPRDARRAAAARGETMLSRPRPADD